MDCCLRVLPGGVGAWVGVLKPEKECIRHGGGGGGVSRECTWRDGQGERQQRQGEGLSEPHTSDQEPKRQQITNKALKDNKVNTFFLSSS